MNYLITGKKCVLQFMRNYTQFRAIYIVYSGRVFNGSVNIPETCDFRSQFDPLNIAFYLGYFFVGI